MSAWSFLLVPSLLQLGASREDNDAPPDASTAESTEEQPGGLSLAWTAPNECPDESGMRQRLGDLVGASASSSRKLRVTVNVVSREGAFELLLLTETDSAQLGQRTLRAQNCEELADAVAVIIAMAMDDARKEEPGTSALPLPVPALLAEQANRIVEDPMAAEDRARESGTSAEELAEDPVEEPAAATTSSPTEPDQAATSRPAAPRDPSAKRSGPFVGGSFVADAGTLPQIAIGPGAVVGWKLGAWQLSLDGAFLPPVVAVDELAPDKGGELSLFSAGATLCYFLWESRALRLAPCAGLSLGSMHGRGRNLASAEESDALWAAAKVGALLEVTRWSPLLLRLGVAGMPALVRSSFEYQREDGSSADLHTPAALSLRLGAGVGVEF